MALDYLFVVRVRNNRIDPCRIHHALMSGFPLKTNPLSDILSGEGVSVSVHQEEHERAEREGFIYPGVCVGFRIDKFDKHEAGMDAMLQMVHRILSLFDVEATLTFEFDDILLARTGTQLTYADDPEFWTPERKAIFENGTPARKFIVGAP
jgi:hypothetical protein